MGSNDAYIPIPMWSFRPHAEKWNPSTCLFSVRMDPRAIARGDINKPRQGVSHPVPMAIQTREGSLLGRLAIANQ